ncbi:MAG: M28 family peptidase [Gemmatimonadota bacterium]
MTLRSACCATLLLATAGCSRGQTPPAAVATLAPARPGCSALPVLDSVALLHDVTAISDDSMLGRAIGSTGSARTRDFLAARFDALGLETIAPGRIQKMPVTSSSSRLKDVHWGANVVGVIRGRVHPDQYIVITAHYDHLGVGRAVAGDSIYNGADDNGSGTAALAVLARHFLTMRPDHSLVFAAVDGEESGMWGSRYFVAAPTVPLDQILLNVNLDMIGRNVNNELYAAGPGKYPLLEPLAEATADCAPIRLTIGHDRSSAGPGNDWTGQSDQGSFHAKGIPFIYFGEEDHPDYHRPSDHADHLMPAFYIGAVRTVADFIHRFDVAPVDARIKPAGQ